MKGRCRKATVPPMAFFVLLPAVLFGAVASIVCVISAGVEITERRRARNIVPRRRGFRPVVIRGGKPDADPAPAAASASDKLAG